MFEDHHVTLISNVKALTENKPAKFETTLAQTLELNGDWEVALMSFTYPVNWLNVKDTLTCAIFKESMLTARPVDFKARNPELREIIKTVQAEPLPYRTPRGLPNIEPAGGSFKYDVCRGTFDIYPGLYTIEELQDAVWDNVKTTLNLSFLQIKYNVSLRKAIVGTSEKFALACPSSNSILDLLGFKQNGSEVAVSATDATKGKYHICRFSEEDMNIAKESPKLPAAIKKLYVYTDFVEDSYVGDTKAPLLSEVPVASKLEDPGVFYPPIPIYRKVISKSIRTITLQTGTDTGALVPFVGTSDTVTCELHFRKRVMFR